jgi:hypothetical protein
MATCTLEPIAIERQVHTVLHRHTDRRRMLGCVAQDRNDEHTDEAAAEAKRMGCWLDRADKDLAHPRDHRRGGAQHQRGAGYRPRRRAHPFLRCMGAQEQ